MTSGPGLHAWPGLLAAFSLPNHPVVDGLLGRAAAVVTDSATGVVFSGYPGNAREAVWSQVAAIYAAVVAERVRYRLPPASFLDEGQKIRTPDRIVEGGVATCLDFTMLFVACSEQAGLNPLVRIQEGMLGRACSSRIQPCPRWLATMASLRPSAWLPASGGRGRQRVRPAPWLPRSAPRW